MAWFGFGRGRARLPQVAESGRVAVLRPAVAPGPAAFIAPRRPERPADQLDHWSAPPTEALPYRLMTRLRDTYHGWRDGLRGIPLVEDEQTAADPDDLVASGFGETPIEAPGPVETPWTLARYREGEQQIDDEWIAHHRETAHLTARLAVASARTESLRHILEHAATRLEEAAKPPDPTVLTTRRPVEDNPQARSDVLVRNRRLGDHDRHLAATQAAHFAAYEAYRESSVEMLILSDQIRRRAQVTEIRVHRIEDHTWRRVGTYWRKLVRVHKGGPVLNSRQAPLSPRLPRWSRDAADRDRLD